MPLYCCVRLRRCLCVALILITLSGCAGLSQHWQLEKQDDDVQYFVRQGMQPSLPEFKAAITVEAPLSRVMMLMTDFSRHPEWVYGCKESSVITLQSYSEAYLYQVTALPIIRDRDMLMHATTHNEGGGKMRIALQAVPAYCDDNDADKCVAIRASQHVRVTQAKGEFILTRVDDNRTHIEWIQFVDPAGMLPHCLYRAALPRVPLKSLQRFKVLVEQE